MDPKVAWLHELKWEYSSSDSFTIEMSNQLTEQAKKLAEINLQSKYFGWKISILSLSYNKNNLGIINADLICPDIDSEPITIVWRSKKRPGIKILPSDIIDDSYEMEFSWVDLPVEILKKYAKPYKIYKASSEGFSFDIEYWYTTWPDISIIIETQMKLSKKDIKFIKSFFYNCIKEWNDRNDDEKGVIHDLGRVDVLEQEKCWVFLDLGSAHISVIDYILKGIDKNLKELGIKKVMFR